jgi:hypothetical protein
MYYILDSTRTDRHTQKDYVATFPDVANFITYLEGVCQRKFGMTRAQFVQDQSNLVGFSENTDTSFYDMMKNHRVNMGIVRRGNCMECDVLRENKYASCRAEFGD